MILKNVKYSFLFLAWTVLFLHYISPHISHKDDVCDIHIEHQQDLWQKILHFINCDIENDDPQEYKSNVTSFEYIHLVKSTYKDTSYYIIYIDKIALADVCLSPFYHSSKIRFRGPPLI